MLDPNNVMRYINAEIEDVMLEDNLGMWIRIEDYWKLKNDWIEKNNLINSAIAALQETKGGK